MSINATAAAPVPMLTDSYARQFVLNAVSGVAGRLLQLGISLFLVGYVVRKLGSEQWGIVVLATTTVSFLSLIELGTSVGIAKKLNTFMTRGEMRRFGQYFTAGMFLCTVLSVAMLMLLLAALTILWPHLNVTPELSREGKFVLIAVTASAVCTLLSLPYGACLQALHRIDVNVNLASGAAIVRCVLTVVLFEFTAPRAATYGCVLGLTNAVQVLYQGVWVHRRVPEARFVLRLLNFRLLREVVAFNVLTVFNSVTYVVFMQAPAFVLQAKSSLGVTGLYGIALQLNNVVRGFLMAPTNALSPVAVSLESSGKGAQLKQLFCISTKVYASLGLMMWVWFLLVGDRFLHLWLARDVDELVRALPWLIAASAIGTVTMPSAVVIVALERLRLPAASGVVLSCAMVAVMLTIVETAQAHVLTTISIVLAGFFSAYQLIRFWIVVRALGVTLWQTVTELLLRPALPGAGAGMVLWIANRYGATDTVVELGAATVLTGVVFAGVSYIALVGRDERSLAWALLSKSVQSSGG